MRLLPRILVVLTAFALVVASLTVPMASVMEAARTVQADMSADGQSDAMPGCADCGRSAVPANACAMHCVIPPADIAATAALIVLPVAVPTAAAVPGFTGLAPAPNLHPPRATA
jgi:hypothetical protein